LAQVERVTQLLKEIGSAGDESASSDGEAAE
jgi:hypothetical protein